MAEKGRGSGKGGRLGQPQGHEGLGAGGGPGRTVLRTCSPPDHCPPGLPSASARQRVSRRHWQGKASWRWPGTWSSAKAWWLGRRMGRSGGLQLEGTLCRGLGARGALLGSGAQALETTGADPPGEKERAQQPGGHRGRCTRQRTPRPIYLCNGRGPAGAPRK